VSLQEEAEAPAARQETAGVPGGARAGRAKRAAQVRACAPNEPRVRALTAAMPPVAGEICRHGMDTTVWRNQPDATHHLSPGTQRRSVAPPATAYT